MKCYYTEKREINTIYTFEKNNSDSKKVNRNKIGVFNLVYFKRFKTTLLFYNVASLEMLKAIWMNISNHLTLYNV